MQQYDLKMGKYCSIELMCVSGWKVSMVFFFWSLAHCGGRSRNTSKISKQHKELFFKKKVYTYQNQESFDGFKRLLICIVPQVN